MTYSGFVMTFNARLRANWVITASNLAVNFCWFKCPTASCKVQGADALPVELLDFNIEQLQNSITLPDSVGLHVGEKLKEQIAKVYSEKK